MSKILIVEDEEAIADLEKDYLELSGFEVEVANDGETGLKKALENDYDLFILDLMLPGGQGIKHQHQGASADRCGYQSGQQRRRPSQYEGGGYRY